MPSVTINLVEAEATATYTAYRYDAGGVAGWLTGIRNMSIGTIWFPRAGTADVDLDDPTTVVRLEAWATLSPEQMQDVYGSPIPALPVEIVALTDFIDSNPGDDNTDPDDTDPDSGFSRGIAGETLPFLQVTLDYLLSAPVDFAIGLGPAPKTTWQRDGCGHAFQLTGSTITVNAHLSNLNAPGTVVGTSYVWTATGANVTAGTTDTPTTDTSITLDLPTAGSVEVTVAGTVTTELGSGIQTVTESGTSTGTYVFDVLTPDEAQAANIICKLLQQLLQFQRFIQPGDPARRRYNKIDPAARVTAVERFTTTAGTVADQLTRLFTEPD